MPARRRWSPAGTALTAPLQDAGWLPALQVRDVSLLWRAIIALTIGYSAFIAEVFRAGIQAVDKGQIEAAKALGLKRGQRFRLIVLPQAIRTILPPLGNDFIAMVKDSSLVSVLGVADITQMGKIYAAGSFRFFETYSIVAYIYLILTVGLSLALRAPGAAAAPAQRTKREDGVRSARIRAGRISMITDKANAALDMVYAAKTPDELAAAYAAWAATYDSETASLGYSLPFADHRLGGALCAGRRRTAARRRLRHRPVRPFAQGARL